MVALVHVELQENDTIFENGTQRSQQPTQIQQKIPRVASVKKNLAGVREVSQRGEHEKQQAQAFY